MPQNQIDMNALAQLVQGIVTQQGQNAVDLTRAQRNPGLPNAGGAQRLSNSPLQASWQQWEANKAQHQAAMQEERNRWLQAKAQEEAIKRQALAARQGGQQYGFTPQDVPNIMQGPPVPGQMGQGGQQQAQQPSALAGLAMLEMQGPPRSAMNPQGQMSLSDFMPPQTSPMPNGWEASPIVNVPAEQENFAPDVTQNPANAPMPWGLGIAAGMAGNAAGQALSNFANVGNNTIAMNAGLAGQSDELLKGAQAAINTMRPAQGATSTFNLLNPIHGPAMPPGTPPVAAPRNVIQRASALKTAQQGVADVTKAKSALGGLAQQAGQNMQSAAKALPRYSGALKAMKVVGKVAEPVGLALAGIDGIRMGASDNYRNSVLANQAENQDQGALGFGQTIGNAVLNPGSGVSAPYFNAYQQSLNADLGERSNEQAVQILDAMRRINNALTMKRREFYNDYSWNQLSPDTRARLVEMYREQLQGEF